MTSDYQRSFGRVKGRPLKPRQAGLVDTLLPHLALPDGPIELEALFTAPAPGMLGLGVGVVPEDDATLPLVLEIGFGGGEHLVAQAATHPDCRFLGAEPFLNGMGSCLRHIEESGVQNVRLHHGDARDLIARLPDASLDRVYILFPDPWPKTRHWKRRVIQPDFLTELARVVKPSADVCFATDWKHYAAWTLELFTRDQRFTWTADCAADWRQPWPGHVPTRYEQKGLGDCAPIFLRFSNSG